MKLSINELKDIKNEWSDDIIDIGLSLWLSKFMLCNENSGNPSIFMEFINEKYLATFNLWSCGNYALMVVDANSEQEYVNVDKEFKELDEPQAAFNYLVELIK